MSRTKVNREMAVIDPEIGVLRMHVTGAEAAIYLPLLSCRAFLGRYG